MVKHRPSNKTRAHEGGEVSRKPTKATAKSQAKPQAKSQPKPQSKPQPQSSTAPALPSSRQQHLLSIFNTAFAPTLSSETFPSLLQEIKSALFNRDFAKAFGSEDFLEAYAARWSPTRALCYAAVLEGLREEIERVGFNDHEAGGQEGDVDEGLDELERRKTVKMVAIGGCAAEHVAFSSFLSNQSIMGNLKLVDSAPWTDITKLLQNTINTPPPASEYASEAAETENKPLIEASQLSLNFAQRDVLELDQDQLREIVGEQKCLVSIFFTLNELYTNGGIGKTTKLLKNLGEVLSDRSLLLVLDSPGSYSETALGKENKKYPMHWLLNHTLLETKSEGYKWEKLESDDSVWFRLSEGLKYPIQLENMRYQMHLYRVRKAT